jgi:hypothetical protein
VENLHVTGLCCKTDLQNDLKMYNPVFILCLCSTKLNSKHDLMVGCNTTMEASNQCCFKASILQKFSILSVSSGQSSHKTEYVTTQPVLAVRQNIAPISALFNCSIYFCVSLEKMLQTFFTCLLSECY